MVLKWRFCWVSVCSYSLETLRLMSPLQTWIPTDELSGPVLRDTARLSQRYPPIARYGVFGVSTWPIGCDTPSPFSERFPLGEHAKWRCDTPPPPKRGISAILAQYPMKTRQNACDTPLCDTISKGYCAVWGCISHWAAKHMRDSWRSRICRLQPDGSSDLKWLASPPPKAEEVGSLGVVWPHLTVIKTFARVCHAYSIRANRADATNLVFQRIAAPSKFLGPAFGRTDFSRIFIFGPPDFFADFLPHFWGKKCPEKSSRTIPGKILQNLYNKIPPTYFCRLAGAKV